MAPSAARHASERVAERALAAWRERVLPDPSVPLGADDVARLVRECFDAVGIDSGAGESFSAHTVHYYRRKDIVDAPVGRTASARYGLRHVWQAAGARLAGHLNLVTLAEARRAIQGADEGALFGFVVARVTDAWAREATRRNSGALDGEAVPALATAIGPRPIPLEEALSRDHAASFVAPDVGASAIHEDTAIAEAALTIRLPGDAWCVIPASHDAHRSAEAARSLVRALANALGAHPAD